MESKYRISNNLGTTIPEPVDSQLRARSLATGYRRSNLMRFAIKHALAAHHVFTPTGAHTFNKPTRPRTPLLAQARQLSLTSNHRQVSVSCEVNPIKHPNLREGIDRYTQTYDLTTSLFVTYSILLYLQTPIEEDEQTDPTTTPDNEPDDQPKT